MPSYTLLPLPGHKPLYTVEGHAELFAKGRMIKREITIQREAASLGIAPTICKVLCDPTYTGRHIAIMERIQGISVADFYGDVPAHSLPPTIWMQIRHILQSLWNRGIEYVDITPYNFMLEAETDRVWVVDFGHARKVQISPHLRTILEDTDSATPEWNSDFT